MRERIIAGNWKMNTTPREGTELARGVADAVTVSDRVTVVICPPATNLINIGEAIKGSSVEIGAQNVHWEEKGAFTGELSRSMLEEIGCRWVIIGHSERRKWFGETDRTVNMRIHRIIGSKLRPIVCVGETLEEREAGRTFEVLERQVRVGLEGVELRGRGGVVIAYEPIWAIGTGHTATPDQAQEVHRFIRDLLGKIYSRESASQTVIQYGGSVNDENAAELMECEDVDGGLIGGASLNVEKFIAIVNAAAAV